MKGETGLYYQAAVTAARMLQKMKLVYCYRYNTSPTIERRVTAAMKGFHNQKCQQQSTGSLQNGAVKLPLNHTHFSTSYKCPDFQAHQTSSCLSQFSFFLSKQPLLTTQPQPPAFPAGPGRKDGTIIE
jgi:hypothetical protein